MKIESIIEISNVVITTTEKSHQGEGVISKKKINQQQQLNENELKELINLLKQQVFTLFNFCINKLSSNNYHKFDKGVGCI